jgi:hypothetical protein
MPNAMTYGDLLCVGWRDSISRLHLKVVIRALRENDGDKGRLFAAEA